MNQYDLARALKRFVGTVDPKLWMALIGGVLFMVVMSTLGKV